MSESGDGCLVIENERGSDTIRPNTKLRLSEQRSAISWNRKKALQRVLDKESVIPNLISYFELHTHSRSKNMLFGMGGNKVEYFTLSPKNF